jgi:hypothetical protein
VTIVLILGSGPNAVTARDWPRSAFDHIVAINNAHLIRPDWSHHIFPWDFPPERVPAPSPEQTQIQQTQFVPAQNDYGGFVYAGGTMAFTAAYWALSALRPKVLAFMGCDMQYPASGDTHFYGKGTADPLREDITLRSLEAKSARMMILAARQGCAAVNLSTQASRLVLPRAQINTLAQVPLATFDAARADQAMLRETALNYVSPTGRYWEEAERFDPKEIDALDCLWLAAAQV